MDDQEDAHLTAIQDQAQSMALKGLDALVGLMNKHFEHELEQDEIINEFLLALCGKTAQIICLFPKESREDILTQVEERIAYSCLVVDEVEEEAETDLATMTVQGSC
jgi:hypothetical protein